MSLESVWPCHGSVLVRDGVVYAAGAGAIGCGVCNAFGVLDDRAQGITDVIRGSDLLDSTPRQLYLMQCLGATPPRYGHFPVITDAGGHKLSKQNHAPALDDSAIDDNLRRALAFLRQPTPPDSERGAAALLHFATAHWALDRIPQVLSLPA